MSGLEALAARAGSWQGTYELRGDPSFKGDSASTAVVTPIGEGKLLRVDYAWDSGGPQEGTMVVAADTASGEATIGWVDSWHMNAAVMFSKGRFDSDAVDVLGSWRVGESEPELGWRTRLEPTADGWSMRMWVVPPGEQEAPAVTVEYRRAGGGS